MLKAFHCRLLKTHFFFFLEENVGEHLRKLESGNKNRKYNLRQKLHKLDLTKIKTSALQKAVSINLRDKPRTGRTYLQITLPHKELVLLIYKELSQLKVKQQLNNRMGKRSEETYY